MKYPEMRVELLGYLRDLSDWDYQKDCWINGKCPVDVQHDELDYSVNFLFDDTGLADNPDEQIGAFLNNKEEAEVVALLCKKLQKIFDIYGTDLSDQEYQDGLSLPPNMKKMLWGECIVNYVFLMLIVLLSIRVAANEIIIEYQCPGRIETVQKIKEPIGVWRESVNPPFSNGSEGERNYSEHNLDYVSFSDGAPEERTFLIPDNEHELDSELWVARWKFINSESI